ncbi:ribosomal protein L1p/L10e family-domain-containing protein [Lentinula aciculospora]|uniref:Ribosomal L1 domain-containing protein 1 n=1 Tax=Lentinula aciculospora TaxID=153920 RepID=A0A9W9DR84_9AGAR|nr:ribosomal protein L1p/L10e family-domain-containing protein [Lentinula aciculospora]
MAKDDLIDDRVSLKQCQQAVDALFAHVSKFTAKKAETQLLPDAEQSFWLTIALKKQPERSRLKVFSIPVTYPVVDPRKESVCLITKDPQRTYKDLIEDNKIHFIHKVIGIKKLKGKYKAYDARRALMKEHGLFLADDRVIPLLPKLLGSKFFAAKKQPLPVNITRKDLKKELERAVSSTYMPSIRGTALSIKVGRMSQSASQVIANIKTALPAIAARVNDGWDNIQSLGLKTSNSATLPIWTCSLNDSPGGRWAGLTAKDEEESESEGETDEDEEEETKGGSQKKKEKKETKTAPPAEVLQKTSAPEVEKEEETSKKKKEKKAKSSNEDAPATGMTEATVAVTKKDDEKKEKKEKKKGKKLIVAAASTPKDDAMVVDTIPATDESEKKPRKDKKSTVGDKEKPPIVLNKEELKQKKSEAPGEKKKKKVLKAKGGRSAKEMLLGRKVV